MFTVQTKHVRNNDEGRSSIQHNVNKMLKNIKKILYFGRPNQPSSGNEVQIGVLTVLHTTVMIWEMLRRSDLYLLLIEC